MAMILQRLASPVAAAAGIPALDISQDELDLMADPNLLHWWRADVGFDTFGWTCRKTGYRLAPERSALPTLQTISAYNGKPSLIFSPTRQLWDNGNDLMPIGGDLSLLVVGRAGTEDNARLFGGAGDDQPRTFLSHVSNAAALGRVAMYVNFPEGGNAANYSVGATGEYYYAGGPNLIIGSHAPGAASNRVSCRVNGGNEVVSSPVDSSNPNAVSELHVAGVNDYGDAITGGIDNNGDLAEIMIFDAALHIKTGLRDIAERYINARYALW